LTRKLRILKVDKIRDKESWKTAQSGQHRLRNIALPLKIPSMSRDIADFGSAYNLTQVAPRAVLCTQNFGWARRVDTR